MTNENAWHACNRTGHAFNLEPDCLLVIDGLFIFAKFYKKDISYSDTMT